MRLDNTPTPEHAIETCNNRSGNRELFHQFRHQPVTAVPLHEDVTRALAEMQAVHALPAPRSTLATERIAHARNIERPPSIQLQASSSPTKAPAWLARSSVPATTALWEPSTGGTRVVSPHIRCVATATTPEQATVDFVRVPQPLNSHQPFPHT